MIRYALWAILSFAGLACVWLGRDHLPQPALDALRSGRAALVDRLVGQAQRARQSGAIERSVDANWAMLAELPAPCVRWEEAQGFLSNVEAIGGPGDERRPILIFSDYRCGFCRADVSDLEQRIRSRPSADFCFVETPLLGATSVELATRALARTIAGEDYMDVRRSVFEGGGASDAALQSDAIEQARALVVRNLDVARKVGVGSIPVYVLEDRVVIGNLGND